MLFSVNEIICFVSQYMTLKTGDLIFTGTPEGVSKVTIGDRLEAFLGEQKLLDFMIK
jgi:2-keto-4-pentenoate hydratase/2-oxohepta-3-ene-1,7-dioic acid hydratase in catechol pathway